MKKAAELVPLIINAKTKEEAIAAIRKTMELLNLTSDYVILNSLKTELEQFEVQYGEIERRYRELAVPRSYEDVHSIRVDLNFLYRDVSDRLSFDVNKNKAYWEECRTAVRGEAMLDLNAQEDLPMKKSVSALENLWGTSSKYKEYMVNFSMAYGMYKNLDTLLNSMKAFIDALSSEERHILTILSKDPK